MHYLATWCWHQLPLKCCLLQFHAVGPIAHRNHKSYKWILLQLVQTNCKNVICIIYSSQIFTKLSVLYSGLKVKIQGYKTESLFKIWLETKIQITSLYLVWIVGKVHKTNPLIWLTENIGILFKRSSMLWKLSEYAAVCFERSRLAWSIWPCKTSLYTWKENKLVFNLICKIYMITFF